MAGKRRCCLTLLAFSDWFCHCSSYPNNRSGTDSRAIVFLFHYGSRSFPTNTQPTRIPKATISVTTTPAQNMKNSMNDHFFSRVPNARIDGTHSPTNNPYCFASSGLPAHAPPKNHRPTLSTKLKKDATKMLPVRTLFIVSSIRTGGIKNYSSHCIRVKHLAYPIRRWLCKYLMLFVVVFLSYA